MPAFLLTAKGDGLVNTGAHVDGVVVVADDEAAARELAAAMFDADFDWRDADAAEAASFVLDAPADYEGWRVSVVIRPGGGGFVKYSASATAATAESFEDMLDSLVTALVALGLDASRAILDVQVAGAGDNLGDHIVTAQVFAPGCDVPITSFVDMITQQGDPTDELHVAYATPSDPPAALLKFRQPVL